MSRTVPPAIDRERESAGSGATGAGTPRQLRPPSSVRTTDVHGARRHGASPSTYAVWLDANVTDQATNPRGTAPPGASPDDALTGAVDSPPAEPPPVDVPPLDVPAAPGCPPAGPLPAGVGDRSCPWHPARATRTAPASASLPVRAGPNRVLMRQ